MKNTKTYIILGFLLVLFTFSFFIFHQVTKERPTDTSSKSKSQDSLQNYYALYKDPYVIQIRTTLDSYLKDPKALSEIILEGLGDGKSGLNNFSKDYYKGRFVVMDIKNSISGGMEVNILFPDKPDKVFWVWVYGFSDGNYELKGFSENTLYTQGDVEYYLKTYSQLISDKNYSL